MLHSITHRALMEKIVGIYIECNIQAFPIDHISIIDHYGFKIYSYSELQQLNKRIYELAIAYSKDSFTFANMIAYNERQSKSRVLFSLMHEFGHNILGHEEDTNKNEDDADEFASNFLAPRILIYKFGLKTADQIHETFGLSYAASNRALLDYKEWFSRFAHAIWRPSPPERQLELLFFPEKEKPVKVEMQYEEDDIEDYEPTPQEKYSYILRALRANLPIPPEYQSTYRMYQRMGLRLK